MNKFGFSTIDDDIPEELYRKRIEPQQGEKARWSKPKPSAIQSFNETLKPRYNDKRAGLSSMAKPWKPEPKRFTAEESLQEAQKIWDNREALEKMAKLIGMESAIKFRDRIISNHVRNLI